MLQAHGIAVQRGERKILSDIDLSLPAGQVIGVLGANGAGKSTLLAALAGELSPSTGRITLNGRPLSAWPAAELARCRAVLPQSPSLQFDLPVATVIGMGAYPHARHTRTEAPRTDSRDTAQAAIAEDQCILQRVLALADVQDLYERRYRRLSGGEQQMLAVGRALMSSPELLFLDEPSLGLAPNIVLLIFDMIKEIQKQGVTILLVEQNANLALQTSNRAYVLENGLITMQGDAKEIANNPKVKEAYLGIG